MQFRLDLTTITVLCFTLCTAVGDAPLYLRIGCFSLPFLLTIYFARYWQIKTFLHAWLCSVFVLAPALLATEYPFSASWLNKLVLGAVLFAVIAGTSTVTKWAREAVPADQAL